MINAPISFGSGEVEVDEGTLRFLVMLFSVVTDSGSSDFRLVPIFPA